MLKLVSRIKVDKVSFYFMGILSLIFGITYYYIFDTKADIGGDNFDYLNYAGSILKGNGYTSPYNPSNPPTNWFPPGYPYLLAIVMFFTGKNLMLIKVLNGLFFLGSTFLLYDAFKRIFPLKFLLFAIFAAALMNSGLLRFATIVMSEIPYLFFSCCCLWFIIKHETDEHKNFLTSHYFYLIVLTAGIVYYFRGIGVSLILAYFGYLVFNREFKKGLFFIVGVGLLHLPWIIRNNILGLKGRYLKTMMVVNPWRPEEGQVSTFSEFWDKILTNFNDTIITGWPEVVFPFLKIQQMSYISLFFCAIIIIALTFYGCWKLGRLKSLMILYLVVNVAIIMLWHPGNGSRYVWPLAPFIALMFFIGVYYTLSWVLGESRLKFFPGLIVLMGFMCIPKLNDLNAYARQPYPPAYNNYFLLGEYIGKNGPAGSMVICRKPGMLHYYSDSFVASYKYSLDDKEVIKDMIQKGTDYVILEQLGYGSTGSYLYPAIKNNSELFQILVHLKNPDTYLLRFNRDLAKIKLDNNLGKN